MQSGTLIEAVQRIIANRDVITSSAVIEALNKKGFKSPNQKPIAAISAILAKLEKRGVLVQVQEAKGNTPAEYRRSTSTPKKAKVKDPPKRGVLIAAVQEAIERQDVITSPAILAYLNKRGFKFVNEDPLSAISVILGKLKKRGKLILTRRGMGRTPAEYRCSRAKGVAA